MRSLIPVFILAMFAGCQQSGEPKDPVAPAKIATPVEAIAPAPKASPAEDLAAARKAFISKITRRGPAPQPYENQKPPAGVKEVEYTSGDLKLKGWLSATENDGKKRPAVVFLHGGWAFGDGDWEDAEPFVKAGFVLFMPMLRAENGNPGIYEAFLGEVDDAIVAGRFVSSQPGVDSANVFVVGHSVGGVLTCLVSMLPSPYKAAAAFDGYVDMESWAIGSPEGEVPYDARNPEEIRIRNPMAFASSIRCPLRLYVGDDGRGVNAPLAEKARKAGKDCELIVFRGDHHEMVAPSVQDAIKWFKELGSK
jgi:dipeptidyl aminopeptidase/acylaminoacyl peptidase